MLASRFIMKKRVIRFLPRNMIDWLLSLATFPRTKLDFLFTSHFAGQKLL